MLVKIDTFRDEWMGGITDLSPTFNIFLYGSLTMKNRPVDPTVTESCRGPFRQQRVLSVSIVLLQYLTFFFDTKPVNELERSPDFFSSKERGRQQFGWIVSDDDVGCGPSAQ
jgi:hypothetical protein